MKCLQVICIVFCLSSIYCEPLNWEELDAGLEFIQLDYDKYTKINVLRIDPDQYNFNLFMTSESGETMQNAKNLVDKEDLVCAFNAGMYDVDYTTNVGYMKHYDHLNNGRINGKYYSFAAFNPVDESSKPFDMFDKDADFTEEVLEQYNTLIQNLRLIKKPGINVWGGNSSNWPELALGKDFDDNVLVIFCTTSLKIDDFNNFLLTESIGITAAQHLEGNFPASFYLNHNGKSIQFAAGHFIIDDEASCSYRNIPNIIGVSKK